MHGQHENINKNIETMNKNKIEIMGLKKCNNLIEKLITWAQEQIWPGKDSANSMQDIQIWDKEVKELKLKKQQQWSKPMGYIRYQEAEKHTHYVNPRRQTKKGEETLLEEMLKFSKIWGKKWTYKFK